MLLETARLRLRDFTSDDLGNLVALNTPTVLRFINGGEPTADDELPGKLEWLIERNARWRENGYGLWPANRLDNGEFVGWFALKPLPSPHEADIEVGYRLVESQWGLGFATEGTQALLQYAWEDLELDRVVGITDPEHDISQRVLQKCGLRPAGTLDVDLHDSGTTQSVSYFEIHRP